MALNINRGERPHGSHGAVVSDRRLSLTANKELVVEAGDPRAAFLFATPGYEIPAGEVERLGLTFAGGKVVLPGAAPPERAEPESDPEASSEAAPDQGDGDNASAEPGLPDDLPGLDELLAGGLVTIEAVAAHADLTEIDGIGKATAARIAEYLAAQDEGDAGDS